MEAETRRKQAEAAARQRRAAEAEEAEARAAAREQAARKRKEAEEAAAQKAAAEAAAEAAATAAPTSNSAQHAELLERFSEAALSGDPSQLKAARDAAKKGGVPVKELARVFALAKEGS